ncbi:conserved hypothetical protein [Ricinus communis]|uniref:SAM domain-containing protein n=1 Tax=Ricinus communis TaxID=3988 RepID=B9RFX9_RICCO|nr:conserved hypothetical protein [Ricinus communis]
MATELPPPEVPIAATVTTSNTAVITPAEPENAASLPAAPKQIEGNGEFGGQRKKAKRAKRVRSNWIASRVDEGGDSREDGDEGFRDFDQDSEQQSPLHSNDNIMWHGHKRTGMGTGTGRVRVSENDGMEMDYYPEKSDSRDRKCSTSEGVRTWLIELGLSRYAPVFEVHEVDDQVLPLLTLEDLKDMGINAVGSRRKLYSAIQKLRKGYS